MMTDEEANSFAVSINEYKIKIRDHHRAIVANKSKGNCHTKDEHQMHMIAIVKLKNANSKGTRYFSMNGFLAGVFLAVWRLCKNSR
jgi:hypothetical protein